ncbi:MAG TPA: YqhA family protein [Gammaproteobacteria bacterium]|nr:YqhA family protein [Gammaproteobacteria bacterium]
MKKLEEWFESALWGSRFVVLFAVIASLATALVMFFTATVDAWFLVTHLFDYASPDLTGEARASFRSTTVTHVVEIIDGYLLATVLLIFALGLYELFISRIEPAEQSETASSVLIIRSLDDLKSRLAKVILMILIVRYFEYAVSMDFKTPMDLLLLAGGIALVGLALFLTHEPKDHTAHDEKAETGSK